MQHPEDSAVTDPQRLAALRTVRSRSLGDRMPWLAVVIGAVLLVVAAGVAGYTVYFRAGAETADGVVVERIPHDTDRDNTTYRITAEYTVDGHTYRVTPSDSSDPAPQLGEHVQIHYRPGDPGNAQVDDWNAPVVVALIGLFFLGVGMVLARSGARTRRRYEALVRNGRPLTCIVESVGARTTHDAFGGNSTDSGGSTKWVLTARYDDPPNSQVLRFEREFGTKPRTPTGAVVTVFVDPDTPSHFVVVAD